MVRKFPPPLFGWKGSEIIKWMVRNFPPPLFGWNKGLEIIKLMVWKFPPPLWLHTTVWKFPQPLLRWNKGLEFFLIKGPEIPFKIKWSGNKKYGSGIFHSKLMVWKLQKLMLWNFSSTPPVWNINGMVPCTAHFFFNSITAPIM